LGFLKEWELSHNMMQAALCFFKNHERDIFVEIDLGWIFPRKNL